MIQNVIIKLLSMYFEYYVHRILVAGWMELRVVFTILLLVTISTTGLLLLMQSPNIRIVRPNVIPQCYLLDEDLVKNTSVQNFSSHFQVTVDLKTICSSLAQTECYFEASMDFTYSVTFSFRMYKSHIKCAIHGLCFVR